LHFLDCFLPGINPSVNLKDPDHFRYTAARHEL
jgi:hypothetical protein